MDVFHLFEYFVQHDVLNCIIHRNLVGDFIVQGKFSFLFVPLYMIFFCFFFLVFFLYKFVSGKRRSFYSCINSLTLIPFPSGSTILLLYFESFASIILTASTFQVCIQTIHALNAHQLTRNVG